MENEREYPDCQKEEVKGESPAIIEEINIEELAVDGICGIY